MWTDTVIDVAGRQTEGSIPARSGLVECQSVSAVCWDIPRPQRIPKRPHWLIESPGPASTSTGTTRVIARAVTEPFNNLYVSFPLSDLNPSDAPEEALCDSWALSLIDEAKRTYIQLNRRILG